MTESNQEKLKTITTSLEEIQKKYNDGIKITEEEFEQLAKSINVSVAELKTGLKEAKDKGKKEQILETLEPLQEKYNNDKVITEKQMNDTAAKIDVTKEQIEEFLEEGKKEFLEDEKDEKEWEDEKVRYDALIDKPDLTDEELKKICEFHPELDYEEMKQELEERRLQAKNPHLEEQIKKSFIKRIIYSIKRIFRG